MSPSQPNELPHMNGGPTEYKHADTHAQNATEALGGSVETQFTQPRPQTHGKNDGIEFLLALMSLLYERLQRCNVSLGTV